MLFHHMNFLQVIKKKNNEINKKMLKPNHYKNKIFQKERGYLKEFNYTSKI